MLEDSSEEAWFWLIKPITKESVLPVSEVVIEKNHLVEANLKAPFLCCYKV